MPGYDAYRGTRFFASLDGLRCLSILAVIWHHCGWQSQAWAAHWSILHMGYRGVDLFFVISGFLITTLLLREREETGTVSLRDFWIRRTLRIFPLYYTVIALYVLTVFLFERHTPAGQGVFRQPAVLPDLHLELVHPARGPGDLLLRLVARRRAAVLPGLARAGEGVQAR